MSSHRRNPSILNIMRIHHMSLIARGPRGYIRLISGSDAVVMPVELCYGHHENNAWELRVYASVNKSLAR